MSATPLDIIDDPARARVALQPIRLRLLHLLERPQSVTALGPTVRTILTDAEGRFSFRDLPRGLYPIVPEPEPPMQLEPLTRSFHRAVGDPDLVTLDECSVVIVFVQRR